MAEAKKPSGQDNRVRRRAEAEQQRRNEAARKGGRKKLPALKDPAKVHLWLLEAGATRLREINEDDQLTAEQRWKAENETTKALAGLQTKADLQREVDALREELQAAQEGLQQDREKLARERAELAQERRKLGTKGQP